ncbi:hypothetical protein CsatA_002923 [Cannabis sativa]
MDVFMLCHYCGPSQYMLQNRVIDSLKRKLVEEGKARWVYSIFCSYYKSNLISLDGMNPRTLILACGL